MVMYAPIVWALSLVSEPLVLVAVALLLCSALGAGVLLSDLLSRKHRDRLSLVAVRRLSWIVAVLAALALLLLGLSI